MEIKHLTGTRKPVIMKPRHSCSWEYLRNEPHVNNEEKWRLKCLKIPI